MTVRQPSVNAGLRPPPSAADGVDRGPPNSRLHLIERRPGGSGQARQFSCQIFCHRRIYADSRRHRQHTFKQAVRRIGAFTYHFWMSDMKPLRRNNGNQHLHRASLKYRNDVKRKLHAYHVFIQAGLVCQGLLQYLSVAFPQLVWSSFGSWLRTIRPGIPPSELVVATALRQRLPEFLLDADQNNIFTKFVAERQDGRIRKRTLCNLSDWPAAYIF